MQILKDIKESVPVFLLVFCLTYTLFDVTGALVNYLNKSGGGIIADKPVVELVNSNNTITLTIDVKHK
jgi:hypothetical protein